jgi:hypothetical protein
VSGYLPQSETELQHARPVSNEPGALPREAILYNERVIYESHPRGLSVHPVAFWVSVAVVAFFLLIGVVGSIGGDTSLGIAVAIVLFFSFPFLIVILWVFYSARQTTYALTDQRVILRRGDDFSSYPYTQVSAVESESRSSKVIVLLASPDHATPGAGSFPPPPMTWKGVRGAPAVAAYAMSATRFYTLRQKQKMLRQDIVTASLEDKIVCEYCRSYIPVAGLDPDNPRCPNCSAPLTVAPIGM